MTDDLGAFANLGLELDPSGQATPHPIAVGTATMELAPAGFVPAQPAVGIVRPLIWSALALAGGPLRPPWRPPRPFIPPSWDSAAAAQPWPGGPLVGSSVAPLVPAFWTGTQSR